MVRQEHGTAKPVTPGRNGRYVSSDVRQDEVRKSLANNLRNYRYVCRVRCPRDNMSLINVCCAGDTNRVGVNPYQVYRGVTMLERPCMEDSEPSTSTSKDDAFSSRNSQ